MILETPDIQLTKLLNQHLEKEKNTKQLLPPHTYIRQILLTDKTMDVTKEDNLVISFLSSSLFFFFLSILLFIHKHEQTFIGCGSWATKDGKSSKQIKENITVKENECNSVLEDRKKVLLPVSIQSLRGPCHGSFILCNHSLPPHLNNPLQRFSDTINGLSLIQNCKPLWHVS